MRHVSTVEEILHRHKQRAKAAATIEDVRAGRQAEQCVGGGSGLSLVGSMRMAGMGILIANHTSLSCSFSSVRRIIPCRRRHLIKVHERFSRNMVFVADEDFDFVYDFLCRYCPNARKS